MGKKCGQGRKAIDWLKAQYEDGVEFADRYAIADALTCELRLNPRIAKANAAEWDRQARYELHQESIYVTNPAPREGYVRNPNASPLTRESALSHLHSHNVTRIENTALQAESAANQIDATRDEIEISVLYEQVRHFTAQINERIEALRGKQ